MNMLKRTLAMMLVLCMLFTMAPITAFAEDTTDPAGTATPAADGGLGGNIPVANQTDANQPDANQTDANQPAANQTDANQPAANQTDANQPDANQPDANQPDANQPDANQPDANQPDANQPDANQPDANQPDANQPDANQPDANQPDANQPDADQPAAGEAEEDPYGIALTAEDDIAPANFEPTNVSLSYADTYRILHLDCGRKYFTKDWIKALINEMAAAGFTHLELAFGNDGLRFLLDDMSVGSYSDAAVTSAIQTGNRNYYNFGTNELTQSEMTAIITHANSKGIKIIPLLNNPGHMNAIVSAAFSLTGSSAGYNGSSSTVDLENADAVAFVKGLVEKYVAYFDSMGCKEFNFGADEYANDVYSSGSMGFGALTNAGKYQLFVNYVNEMAHMIKGYGMVPIAFNDGIYFNQNTSYNFDKQIAVAFWTSGWNGYQSASASTMEDLGHKMINVNGDYYYILGKSDQWDSNGYTYAANWNNSTFMGSTVSNPMGGMFCIWCDYPGAESETQIAANTRMILRAMAAEMQGEDGTAVSPEVIPGGFNANGTIAESCTQETVKNEATNVEVTGCGLTRVDVTEAAATQIPTIADAAAVLAWDITPYAGDAKYEGGATVKLPVPADWNTKLVKGFYMENGAAVTVEGTYADGFYTFKMPHFSVGGLYQAVPAEEGDTEITDNRTINLILGQTKTDAIQGGNYAGNYTTNPEGIASVTAEYEQVEGGMEPVRVESVVSGSAYYLENSNGEYATADAGWTSDISKAAEWTAEISKDGSYFYLLNNGNYLCNDGDWYISPWGDAFYFTNGAFEHWWDKNIPLIPVVMEGTTSVDQTTVTFTGTAVGSATVDVGPVRYTVNVKYAEKAINVAKERTNTDEQSVTVADFMDVTSVVNDYVTATWSGNTVTFTANDQIGTVEMIIGNTKYTVNVIEENLNEVTPLTIEFWQTNARVNAPDKNSDTTLKVTAQEAYSEAGLSLLGRIPATGYMDSTPVVYWRSRLLDSDDPQINDPGSDQTWSGIGFSKVRYWNGGWAVYADATETELAHWEEIKEPSAYQLVAYYMNDMDLADEVKVGTSDWADKGNVPPTTSYTGYNSIVFQVVYEGDTRFPADVTTSAVGDNSYIVHTWSLDNQIRRGVGTIALTKIGDYNIWKVTAETGTHVLTDNNTINSITWDGNERELFVDEKNPVSQYTIYNPAIPEATLVDEKHENTYWDEENESILIRIYLSAEETEDSLKVIYYDEKFGASLAEFPISVPSGSNFNDNIVNVNTGETEVPPVFKYKDEDNVEVEVDGRVNAGGYGIVNALNKTQKFETNLANVAITNNRYNAELYKYTGSVISEDGKTITHYYNINQTALSPNFVVDFGLPLTFKLSDVVQEGLATVMDVTVNPKTLYGTLSYTEDTRTVDGTFTYTPTQILPTIDVLTISITFDDGEGPETVTTNVGVTPATTVYYGEKFIAFGSGWSTEGTPVNVSNQQTAVLGGRANSEDGVTEYIYGYDTAYATSAGASDGTAKKATAIGSSATFTFTGTGIQVFANSAYNTGYVSVMVKNKDTGAITKVSMVDTVVNGTANTDTTGGQIGKNLSGLPVVSLVDLTGLPHATYEVTISKVMDTDPVYIDGIRVFGTVDETKYTKDTNPFTADEEDDPDFYEVRDLVLKALNILPSESVDYKTMYDQVYAQTVEVGESAVITSASANYGTMDRQDLLDNGPKNELYLFQGDTLTMNVSTDRVIQLGLKAPEGSATYKLNGGAEQTLSTTVDMFYKVAEKGGSTHTITVQNTGDKILSVTLLKICDDPNVSFPALTEANIRAILADAGYTEEPEAPTYTMVELKGTDVFIDGTVFDYTGEAIEPAITVNVGGTQLVEGRDYTVTYTNNVQPGTATVTVRGIATASETLGYTGEVSIDYTINAPAEPEVPEEITKPTKPGKPEKPDNGNKPGENRPGNGNNKPGKPSADKNEKQKDAKLKITFVNLRGKKVASATLTKTGAANQNCVFSADEITANAPARRYAVWFFPVIIPYGSTSSIVVPVF